MVFGEGVALTGAIRGELLTAVHGRFLLFGPCFSTGLCGHQYLLRFLPQPVPPSAARAAARAGCRSRPGHKWPGYRLETAMNGRQEPRTSGTREHSSGERCLTFSHLPRSRPSLAADDQGTRITNKQRMTRGTFRMDEAKYNGVPRNRAI